MHGNYPFKTILIACVLLKLSSAILRICSETFLIGLTTAEEKKTKLLCDKYVDSVFREGYVLIIVMFMIIRIVDFFNFISFTFINK